MSSKKTNLESLENTLETSGFKRNHKYKVSRKSFLGYNPNAIYRVLEFNSQFFMIYNPRFFELIRFYTRELLFRNLSENNEYSIFGTTMLKTLQALVWNTIDAPDKKTKHMTTLNQQKYIQYFYTLVNHFFQNNHVLLLAANDERNQKKFISRITINLILRIIT